MALNLPATYPDVSHVRVVLYDEAGSEVATSGTVETLGEGLYGGPISAVRADGSASIVMPDVADLPPCRVHAPGWNQHQHRLSDLRTQRQRPNRDGNEDEPSTHNWIT